MSTDERTKKMDMRRFKTLDAPDAYEGLHQEICKILDSLERPALFRRDGVRLEIWTEEGSPVYSDPHMPSNWASIVHWLRVLEETCGAHKWSRVIQREDKIFIVSLSVGKGEVRYV